MATLHVERLFGQMLGASPPKGFTGRVKAVAIEVATKLKVSDFPKFRSELEAALGKTDLYDLPQTMEMPFLADHDIQHPDLLGQRLVRSFANYAILRNYAAHHDCLDRDLIYSPVATVAVEALLVVALESLTIG